MEIVPAIIPKNFKELKEKIGAVSAFCSWVQIDIMDGVFVPQKTWNNPKEIKNSKFQIPNSKLNLEAHLMVSEIDKKINKWLSSPLKRIIFHYEASRNPNLILQKIKDAGYETGIALNPRTPAKVLNNINKDLLDMVLIMTVEPGFAGQKFKSGPLSKINFIRARFPEIKIGVDGGVNLETAPLVKKAGPDFAAAGSYLWKADDVKKAYFDLKKALN